MLQTVCEQQRGRRNIFIIATKATFWTDNDIGAKSGCLDQHLPFEPMTTSDELHVRVFGGLAEPRVSAAFVDSVLHLGHALQRDRKPGEHFKYKHVAQIGLLHIARGLTGNLGRIAFTIGDASELHGRHWIAPSHKSVVQSVANAEALGSGSIVLFPTADDAGITASDQGVSWFSRPGSVRHALVILNTCCSTIWICSCKHAVPIALVSLC